jgi:hypothetical protein
METLAMIRQAFGEEGMSHKRMSKLNEIKNCDTSEEQSQDHAHNFLLY